MKMDWISLAAFQMDEFQIKVQQKVGKNRKLSISSYPFQFSGTCYDKIAHAGYKNHPDAATFVETIAHSRSMIQEALTRSMRPNIPEASAKLKHSGVYSSIGMDDGDGLLRTAMQSAMNIYAAALQAMTTNNMLEDLAKDFLDIARSNAFDGEIMAVPVCIFCHDGQPTDHEARTKQILRDHVLYFPGAWCELLNDDFRDQFNVYRNRQLMELIQIHQGAR